jgi:hypothetical protein
VTARRPVPPDAPSLFVVDPRSGRAAAALERGLKVLREGDALEPTDVFVVALLRSEVQAFDRDARRPDVSAFALTAAGDRIIDHYNALRGNAPLTANTDEVNDLVSLLSASTVDGPAP